MIEIEEYITELIENIAGKEVLPLIALMGIKPISEFKLADRLKETTVNQVRNRLYKLYSYNLVDFIRKKDRKKGWYIYYWSFDSKKSLELALDFKKKKVKVLNSSLGREEEFDYLVCKNDNTRLSIGEAMEHDFKCPECDDLLVRDDNIKRINQIKKETSKLEKDISEIEAILEKEREKELRKLERAKKSKAKPKKKQKNKNKKKSKKHAKKTKKKTNKKSKKKSKPKKKSIKKRI